MLTTGLQSSIVETLVANANYFFPGGQFYAFSMLAGFSVLSFHSISPSLCLGFASSGCFPNSPFLFFLIPPFFLFLPYPFSFPFPVFPFFFNILFLFVSEPVLVPFSFPFQYTPILFSFTFLFISCYFSMPFSPLFSIFSCNSFLIDCLPFHCCFFLSTPLPSLPLLFHS